MRYQGRVYKDGTFWLAEIPVLDLMTQGKTRKEAYAMAVDMVETMVDRPGFQVTLYPGKTTPSK
jgi:predicted RNase H-like HicB family nuclease